jgi:hypothetical protein
MFPTAFYSSLFCFKTKPQISDLLVWKVPYSLRHVVSRVGKETDSEISRFKNVRDFNERILDTRFGIKLSSDLEFTKYPSYSPYSYCAKSSFILIDKYGEDLIGFGLEPSFQKFKAGFRITVSWININLKRRKQNTCSNIQ